MTKPVIALPVSQHFDTVFPQLSDTIGVLLLRHIRFLPSDLANYPYRKAYHANGFIDTQFADEMTEGFMCDLKNFGVYHMSFDCGPSCRDVYFNSEKNGIYWPASSNDILKPEDIISVAEERMDYIKNHFKGTVALENLDYNRGGAYEHVCDPEFISEMIERLDVHLAIDIAHLLVTAYNFGISPLKYIRRLPLKRVREIHISHPEGENDLHDCPTSHEYDLLDYVLANSEPDFIALEYYQNPAKIIDENIKLNRFLNR